MSDQNKNLEGFLRRLGYRGWEVSLGMYLAKNPPISKNTKPKEYTAYINGNDLSYVINDEHSTKRDS